VLASLKLETQAKGDPIMRIAAFVLALLVTASVAHATFFQQRSLYQRLGGQQAIVAVVDDFVGNVARDKRINRFFANTDIPRLKRLLVAQICAGSGGPCVYRGRSMKDAHRGLGIRNRHFNALVEDLVRSLDKFNVPAREQRELLALLGPMRRDIVEKM
jgi:hemoglobin